MEEIEVSHLDDFAHFIRQKLNEYNHNFAPSDAHERLCLVARIRDRIIGVLVGGTYWNWLYVELFWVDEPERHNGLGTRILAKGEELGMQRGCKNVHLETHDFQNRGIFQRCQYVVF